MPEAFDVVTFGPNMVFVGGEIDLATAPRLEEAARPCIEAGGPTMFDLSAVTFIDSTGVRAFVSIARAVGTRGCIFLHAPQPRVRRVLEIVRIDDVPNIHVESCPIVAYPDVITEWSPPPDLRERLDSIRELTSEGSS
jgi:anti-sigma B factor antagonist